MKNFVLQKLFNFISLSFSRVYLMSQADNRMLKLFDTGYTWKGNETEILREQSEPSGNSERKEDQPKKKGNTSLR